VFFTGQVVINNCDIVVVKHFFPSDAAGIYAAVAMGGLGLLAVPAAFLPELMRPPGAAHYAANGVPASGTAPYETPAGGPNNVHPPQRIAEVASDTTATVPAQKAGLGAEAVERRTGVKIIRAGAAAAPEALIIDVAKALNTGLPAAPDPRLIEQTRHGPTPRIGADGARPSEVYARPAVSSGGLTQGAPRIALLIGGMGLAPRATDSAIAKLPEGTSSAEHYLDSDGIETGHGSADAAGFASAAPFARGTNGGGSPTSPMSSSRCSRRTFSFHSAERAT
jgi:hypothetical protein